MTQYVYGIRYVGPNGDRLMTPLFIRRVDALAAMHQREAAWRDLERSGKGSISGGLQIARFELVGERSEAT